MTKATSDSLIGATAYDVRNDKIGKVKQIYLDNASGTPTWAAVSTGLFSGDALVPLAGAEYHADAQLLQVKVDREQVKSAPHQEDERTISPEIERELFAHYGIDPRYRGMTSQNRQQIRPGDEAPMTYGNPEARSRQASGTARGRTDAEGIDRNLRRGD
ncbi:PRC-barrel domain-containing protein [Nocardia sp. NPDC005366]|uniref:PRC-barrel domain-containing protein n=1 Tax=Nocardia sp. NPDC005366 TaxID=3156878 RepID=UPI0033A0440F